MAEMTSETSVCLLDEDYEGSFAFRAALVSGVRASILLMSLVPVVISFRPYSNSGRNREFADFKNTVTIAE